MSVLELNHGIGTVVRIRTEKKSAVTLQSTSKSEPRAEASLTDAKKKQHNLSVILLNSNASSIRCKNSLGYGCAVYPVQFARPVDLKRHFLDEHRSAHLVHSMSRRIFKNAVKLDITRLSGALCDAGFSQLADLARHLSGEHGERMHADVRGGIVPFNFDTPQLRCAVCAPEYATFKLLQEHMNSHFGSRPCEVCGRCFLTERLLRGHVRRHGDVVHKCTKCEKSFTAKRREHENRTHLGLSKRNKCRFCDERFLDYWKKVGRMVEAHGSPPVVLSCRSCGRKSDNQRALSRHTKRDHLLERTARVCEMAFFSSSCLQKHMAKHTRLRQYKCDVCGKSYARMNTLGRHMVTPERRAVQGGSALRAEMQLEMPRAVAARRNRLAADCGQRKKANKAIMRNATEATNTEARSVLSDEAKPKPIKEFKKHQENLKFILQYSNASLIRGKDSDGYGCNFCPKRFQLPRDLKAHSLHEHSDVQAIRLPKFTDYLLKLDITGLTCKICHGNFEMLDQFTTHLRDDHAKGMHTDVNSEIVPFRFDTDSLRCAACRAQFGSFKTLQQHMHVHYGNHICHTCNAGFATRRRLAGHERRHGAGCHRCGHCEKTFACEGRRRDHERRIHLGLKKRNKCQHCDERFADYWTKVDHMVRSHGVPRVTLNCLACERTFDNRRALTRHVKKDHLLEREHACDVCGMRFYLKHRLKDHMLVHTGEKRFQCNVCERWYATQKSLRQHLRTHADDRRHVCPVCGQAFVQRSTLANHIRAKHGAESSIR
ncbi:unnamed protein product, partial [Iphiclides podalirius]